MTPSVVNMYTLQRCSTCFYVGDHFLPKQKNHVSARTFAVLVLESDAFTGSQEKRGYFRRQRPSRYQSGGSGQVPPRQGPTAFTNHGNNAHESAHRAMPSQEEGEHLRVCDAKLEGDCRSTTELHKPRFRWKGAQGKACQGGVPEADGNCAGV